eukprot:TRINITY_DN1590_c2_g1_i2.p1 TRINITY_DN1590_c2_g1~~TRINITY_DN1590_c2_g1_i2.p1  ORF type:complete len:330 (+),score=70.40 TRINITY_DN1590_c2_g1_i2:52-1041(+)
MIPWHLSLFLLSLMPLIRGEAECSLKTKKCRTIDFDNYANEPSLLYGESHGRFGNQFLGYALLLQFQRSFGFKSYIRRECKESLDLYFTPSFNELPVLQEEICNWRDIPWEAYQGHFKDFYNDPEYRKGRFILMWPVSKKYPYGYRPDDHLCREQDLFNKALSKYFRKIVTFPQHISDAADITLAKVRAQYAAQDIPIELIGIHNRRTDHHEFMKKNFDVDPLGLSYYKDSIAYFREDLQGEALPVFIYVSDDMEWGRKRLGNERDIHFLGKGTKNGVNTHVENQVYDFALLVKCDKTILGRGTYALWVSILGPPEHYTEYGPVVFDMD